MSTQHPTGDPSDEPDVEVPRAVAPRGAASMVSAASAGLAIAGVFTTAGGVLFSFTGGSWALVALLFGFGIVQLVVAYLAYRRVPIARPLGLAVAVLGIAYFGVFGLANGSGNAVFALFAYGLAIWGLASTGSAFRRR